MIPIWRVKLGGNGRVERQQSDAKRASRQRKISEHAALPGRAMPLQTPLRSGCNDQAGDQPEHESAEQLEPPVERRFPPRDA
jgi:hypothetical protein